MILGLPFELMLVLPEVNTKPVDWASETLGLTWSANGATQADAIHMEGVAKLRWDQAFQVVVALVGATAARPTEARRNPEHVYIHGENLEAERVHHHALGDLIGHAGQPHEVIACRSFIPRA
jgi:hypothetical protein